MNDMNTEQLQLFEDQTIRTAWDEEKEEWYFSIVDVVGALTEQAGYDAARNYWKVLKIRLKEEGNELVTKCNQLKMKSPKDGKKYNTDVANTEQLLRIIQSIPSKKAEPFKLWLAQVGRERMEETMDPELIAERLIATYERKGYTREWINQRLQAISARKELTDEWKDRGVSNVQEYAIVKDEITKTWSGMTTRQYKTYKGLKKESLRDNMSTTELVLNMLAETATKDISKVAKPSGFEENKRVAKRGGSVADVARMALEEQTGIPVVTSQNAIQLNHVVEAMIEASASIADDETEKEGFVETISGRRRYIKAINSANKTEKAAAERIAINTPIQGSAADIVKQAMIKVHSELSQKFPEAKLLLQVHDELIAECPENQAEEVANLIKTTMESVINLSVPLKVSVETGKRWGEFH